MAQQPLNNGDTFGAQRTKINANDADNATAAAAAAAAAATAQGVASAASAAATAAATAAQGAATTAGTAAAAAQALAASALKAPTNWAAAPSGGTPTLTSGSAVLGTAYKNTTASPVTLSPAIDGITQVALGDILICFTAGAYTLLPAGGAYLGTFGSTGALPTAASNAGNSAIVGSTLYFCNGAAWMALGSGGVSTLSALSDVGSFDLGTNNPSVAAIKATANGAAPATALAATNAALATVKPANTAWSTIWDTSAAKDFGEFTITAALALTSSDVASTVGGNSEAVLIADGSHIPTFDGATISNWTNTAGARNRVELRRIGNSKFWLVGSNLGTAISTPVAAVITSAPVIAPITAGNAVTWTAGNVTGVPTPTISYSLKKNGTVVSSPATSGSYSSTTAGDIFIVTQAATNAAYGGGTATPTDSAAVTVTAGADADVTAYAAAVTTAGGTLPTAHQAALNANIAALKSSGAWALIKELWLPLGNAGDLTTAAVKLKNGATAASVTLTNFVTGDYTIGLGIDPGVGNSTKKVSTDFIPSVNGSLSATDWGYSAYLTRKLTTNAGTVMGTAASTASYLQYTGNSAPLNAGFKIGGASQVNINVNTTDEFKSVRLCTAQIESSNAKTYYGGWLKISAAQTSPTLPTGNLAMLTANSGLYGDCAVSGYAIHGVLTPAQLRALQTFFDNVCTAIGRTIFSNILTAVGDSYVNDPTPVGPSSAANDWVAVAATTKGWPYKLAGVSGDGLASANLGIWTSASEQYGNNRIFKYLVQAPTTHAVIPLGLNDGMYGTTGANTSAATELTLRLQQLQDMGYPLQYVVVCTAYWASGVPSQPLLASVASACKTAAQAFGVRVVDFYNGSTFGVTSVEGPTIHKNDAGHTMLANDFVAGIAGYW